MKISYLITCSTETKTLDTLLQTLHGVYVADILKDEIIIVSDSNNTPESTKKIINEWKSKAYTIKHYEHALNNNYGAHKNYGNSLCTGEWIFQIDGDENPSKILILNLTEIIKSNPDVELIFVPRINDFKGVTEEHAKKWGWRLSSCSEYDNRLIVSWPDFQGRIYKNIPGRIKWDRRLHEKIEGHFQFATLPPDPTLALYHDKTIEKQIETNLRYNELFTEKENQGHDVFSQKKTP